jgi:hypothetical protein
VGLWRPECEQAPFQTTVLRPSVTAGLYAYQAKSHGLGVRMSAFHIDDYVRFRIINAEGPLAGMGRIIKIFPAGQSYWLHVRQDDGSVRMLFEATSKIDVTELEPV